MSDLTKEQREVFEKWWYANAPVGAARDNAELAFAAGLACAEQSPVDIAPLEEAVEDIIAEFQQDVENIQLADANEIDEVKEIIVGHMKTLFAQQTKLASQQGYDECNAQHAATHESVEADFAREKALAVAGAIEVIAQHYPYSENVEGGSWLTCSCGWKPESFVENDETGLETWREHIRALIPADSAAALREYVDAARIEQMNVDASYWKERLAQATAPLVEALEFIIKNDKTTYDHHQPRPFDGKTPREVDGGSIFRTPKEIAKGALAAHRAGQDAQEPLCADCGHPRSDPHFHLEAPGMNWGAALHNFKDAPALQAGVSLNEGKEQPR